MRQTQDRDLPSVELVGSRLVEAARKRRRRARLRSVGLASAVLVVALAATLTAPGQEAVAWVGELVSSDDREPQTFAERLENGGVLGSGSVPSGRDYDVFADFDSDEGMCAYFVWRSSNDAWGRCESEGGLRPDPVTIARIDGFDQEALTVSGLVDDRTDEVRIAYSSDAAPSPQSVDAELYTLDPGDATALGGLPTDAYGLFVAQIPNGVGEIASGSRASAIALRDGREIASAPIRWTTIVLPDGEEIVECTGDGSFKDVCARAADPALQDEEFFRGLTAQKLSPDLVSLAAAEGVAIEEPTREDRFKLSSGGEAQLPQLLASKFVQQSKLGSRGTLATYLAAVDGEPVYVVVAASDSPKPGRVAVYDELPVNDQLPDYRRAEIGVIDSVSGDLLETVRLEPRPPG